MEYEKPSATLFMLLVAVAMAGTFGSAPLRAQHSFSPQEVALLPPYCQSNRLVAKREGPETPEAGHWRSVLGTQPYAAIHHYCWGLMFTNRARLGSPNATERRRALQATMGEFEYILRNSPPDFVLRPEIYTTRGENLLSLGRTAEGLQDFERAAAAKPDYWPPYARASDYYKDAGNNAKAREWLEKGLAAAPDSKPLQRRLDLLKSDGGATAKKSAAKPSKPVPEQVEKKEQPDPVLPDQPPR
jgi:tetratricopeptide (TPR) repeat protein